MPIQPFKLELTEDSTENAFRLNNAFQHVVNQFGIAERQLLERVAGLERGISEAISRLDVTVSQLRDEPPANIRDRAKAAKAGGPLFAIRIGSWSLSLGRAEGA